MNKINPYRSVIFFFLPPFLGATFFWADLIIAGIAEESFTVELSMALQLYFVMILCVFIFTGFQSLIYACLMSWLFGKYDNHLILLTLLSSILGVAVSTSGGVFAEILFGPTVFRYFEFRQLVVLGAAIGFFTILILRAIEYRNNQNA